MEKRSCLWYVVTKHCLVVSVMLHAVRENCTSSCQALTVKAMLVFQNFLLQTNSVKEEWCIRNAGLRVHKPVIRLDTQASVRTACVWMDATAPLVFSCFLNQHPTYSIDIRQIAYSDFSPDFN